MVSDDCKCSVAGELWRMVSGWVGRVLKWRPGRPTSLVVRAWWLGFGLVLLDAALIGAIMAFTPPNLITVPAVTLLILGGFIIVVTVVEAYEKCRKQCQGSRW